MICKRKQFYKGIKEQVITLTLLVCMVCFSACYSSPEVKEVTEAPEKIAVVKIEKMNVKDARILEGVYTDGLLQMRLADTVKLYAVFERTKKLAMIVSDLYSDLNAQLVNLAVRKTVTLPGDIAPTQLEALNKMSKIKGTVFDKAYIDTTMAKDRKTIQLFQEYIANCSDSELVQYFENAVPQFQKHLDRKLSISKNK